VEGYLALLVSVCHLKYRILTLTTLGGVPETTPLPEIKKVLQKPNIIMDGDALSPNVLGVGD